MTITIQLLCDVCRQPKDSTTHYSLIRHKTVPNAGGGRRVYSGSIDICDDCHDLVAHDGKDSAHKMMGQRQRVEMGRMTR